MNSYPFYSYPPFYTRQNPYFPSRRSRFPTHFSPPVSSYEKKEEEKKEEDRKTETCFLNDFNHEPIFEIFGIQLFYDDILLICLIFFLYSEGIQDHYLFFALVWLLLS